MVEEQIRDYLTENRYTLTWLSNETGLAVSTLSKIFSGSRSLTQKTLNKINKALKTNFTLPNQPNND